MNNTWDEYHEQRLAELEAENARLRDELNAASAANRKLLVQRSEADSDNERLRAMLPDDETRRDIREFAKEHSRVRAALVLAWLERLERP